MPESYDYLQIDLFTGERIDVRTAQQRQRDSTTKELFQMDLFAQNEVALFGVRAHPVMPFSPGRLQLLSQDPRTEEEREQDLLREAHALTASLFGEVDVQSSTGDDTVTQSSEQKTLETQADDADTLVVPQSVTRTKYAAYLEVVQTAQERSATLNASPVSAFADSITMNLAHLHAQLAGLIESEIQMALQIGNYLGKRARNQMQPIALNPHKVDAVPILWLEREDLLTRRPDLSEKITALSDYEVEALGALVGEALEEFYWIQLNVVLSLYLDHEMRLTRQVRRHS